MHLNVFEKLVKTAGQLLIFKKLILVSFFLVLVFPKLRQDKDGDYCRKMSEDNQRQDVVLRNRLCVPGLLSLFFPSANLRPSIKPQFLFLSPVFVSSISIMVSLKCKDATEHGMHTKSGRNTRVVVVGQHEKKKKLKQWEVG